MRYFDGRITRDEEQQLRLFIDASAENRSAFQAWEDEWQRAWHADESTERAWLALQSHIERASQDEALKTLSQNTSILSVVRLLPLWQKLAAVAVMLLLLTLSATAALRFASQREGDMVACTAPSGSQSEVLLPDGSKVRLNAGSTLRYRTSFDKKDRRVELVGEGWFEVTKHDGAPFTVETRGYDVVVKGTKFDVSAYEDDRYVTTTLAEGSVEIQTSADRLLLKPGESVRLDLESGLLEKSQTQTEAQSWTEGRLTYDAITLDELSKILSRKYNVRIHIADNTLRSTQFAVSLQNEESIDDVMKALNRIVPMNVVRKGRDIYLNR